MGTLYDQFMFAPGSDTPIEPSPVDGPWPESPDSADDLMMEGNPDVLPQPFNADPELDIQADNTSLVVAEITDTAVEDALDNITTDMDSDTDDVIMEDLTGSTDIAVNAELESRDENEDD